MSTSNTVAITAGLVAAILGGTLMPGSAKTAIEGQLWHLVPWASLGHLVLFGCLGWIVTRYEPRRMLVPALLLAAALAFGTEWLQGWVPGRHARLVDVAIDMAGALIGCSAATFAMLRRRLVSPSARRII